MTHPMQPIIKDDNGSLRFKANAIVVHLLEQGGIDMNAIARLNVSDEDRAHFAQLIGYSVSGFGGLSYVSSDMSAVAGRMADTGETEQMAKITHLQGELAALRSALRDPIARLYGLHPDDLQEEGGTVA